MVVNTPLQQFLATNHLQQLDLINYLHLSKSTISQAVSGKSNLSKIKLLELIQNDQGWDVSMLTEEYHCDNSRPIINNTGTAINGNHNKVNSEISRLIDMLEKKDSTIDSLIEQNGKLLDIIKDLKR